MAIFASPDQAGNPDEPKAGVYMLKPGGAVHIRMGTTAIDRGHPTFTGRMSPGEAEQVWFFVQDSGLLLPGNSSQVSASSMVGKRYHRSVAALVITAGGKRRWFKVSLDTSSPDAATVRKLISELARFGPLP